MNNLSVIPFYTNLEEQDFRKWWAYGVKHPNYVPNDYLVPFFFTLPEGDWEIDSIAFYRSCCEEVPITSLGSFNASFNQSFLVGKSVESILVDNGLEIVEVDGHNILMYRAGDTTPLHLESGIYYININVTDGTDIKEYYSDIFFVREPGILENKIKIEWENLDNLEYEGGVIPYEMGYKNVIYVDSEIGQPTYEFTEEGEDRNGRFFPTKQISEKVFNMNFIASEYICDVVRLIRMADIVTITRHLSKETNVGGETMVARIPETYKVEQFELDVEWLEQGYLANVQCSFKTNTIIKKVGKAYSI